MLYHRAFLLEAVETRNTLATNLILRPKKMPKLRPAVGYAMRPQEEQPKREIQ